MKGTINLSGTLTLRAETELEGYALGQWWQKNLQGKSLSGEINFLIETRPIEADHDV